MLKRSVFITAACLAVALTQAGAVELRQAAPPAAFVKPPANLMEIPAVLPVVTTKLRTNVTRQAVVNTLMSNPKTKAVLTEEIAKLGIDSAKIGELSTRTLQSMMSDPSQPAQNTQTTTEDAEYAKLNWNAGITFTPYACPTYYNGQYMVGDMTAWYCQVKASSKEPLRMSFPTPDMGPNWSLGVVDLPLELPKGMGIFVITIKLTRYDGTCPAGLIGPRSMDNNAPIQVDFMYYTSANGGYAPPVTFTPLLDQTGYVGVVSANPGDGVSQANMRKKNASLSIWWRPGCANNVQYSATPCFGGITINRL